MTKPPSDIAPPPSWAPTIWQDGLDLFAQFPAGHVLRYPLTEGGLQKILKLIPNVKRQPGYTPKLADKLLKREPKAKARPSQERRRIVASTTDAEKESIRKIMKRMGI